MMRGRQAEFFMTREDEEAFADFTLSIGHSSFVLDDWLDRPDCRAFYDRATFLEQSPVPKTNPWPMWFIWRCDWGPLVYEAVTVLGKPYYEIVPTKSPVVEFTRSIFRKNELLGGRLAVLLEAESPDGSLVMREPRLLEWYNTLERWIKKHGVRASFDGKTTLTKMYILPGALHYYEQGGRLGLAFQESPGVRPVRKQ